MRNLATRCSLVIFFFTTITGCNTTTCNNSDKAMEDDKNLAIAKELLQAFKDYDLVKARDLMSDKLYFRTPKDEFHTADSFLDFYKGHVDPGVFDYELQDAIVSNNIVVLKYLLILPNGNRIPEIDWYEIQEGKVAKIEAYF